MPELCLGLPNLRYVHIRFALSLMALRVPDLTRIISYERVMIDSVRNMIAKRALEGNYEYLLFLDDDMTFPPNLYFRLKARKKKIIGALAFKREPPFEPCVYKKKGKYFYPFFPPKGCVEVDAIGAAGLLIHTSVLKKIKYPWFETGYDEEGNHWSVDFDFCKKAKKAGFKIFCDSTIEMGHIGSNPIITKEHFLKFHENANSKRDKFNRKLGNR